MEKCTIQILSGGKIQEPAVIEGITWETTRKGEPSKLVFTCIKDDKLSFSEGAEVVFCYGNVNVFSGYVFEKKRNKDHHIEVTCYDRTYYLNTKTSCVMTNVRADQVVTRIAADLGLRIGDVSNTKYVIPTFAKSDMTYIDIILDALDETVMATKELYCLYDDFGSICLKSIEELQTNVLIDEETGEDFDYTTKIDGNTYNRIVVSQSSSDGSNQNATVVAVAEDKKTQKQWGVLEHHVTVQEAGNANAMAQAMLNMYNQVSRSLKMTKQFGHIYVRAGCSVYLNLNLGDMIANQIMIVDKATHNFENGHHTMDLTLIDGRGFYA